jgi:hypothetical protein
MKPDVNVAFRAFLPVGESNFVVSVPSAYRDRVFYLLDVSITPEFYAKEAAHLGFDVDAELDVESKHEISYFVEYIKDAMFPVVFDQDNSMNTVSILIANINQFADIKRPNGLTRLPVFVDWIDIRQAASGKSLDEFVRMNAALYYNVAFDESQHYKKLPATASTVPGANSYLYPTTRDEETLKHISVRLNIAPNVRVHFSTSAQLTALGFDEEQIGQRSGNNQFVFANKRPDRFLTIAGNDAPTLAAPTKPLLKYALKMENLRYASPISIFKITKRDDLKDINYLKSLKTFLNEMGNSTNVDLTFTYDEPTRVFSFVFPENDSMRVVVNLPMDLAERLGFGLVRQIKVGNKSGMPMPAETDVTKSHEKAVALVMDTSLVVVTDDNTTSNTTAGSNELYMAALKPTWAGTMEMSAMAFCTKPPVCSLPTTSEGHRLIPLNFKLSRFLDTSDTLIPLVWNVGAYVSGVLRGTTSV